MTAKDLPFAVPPGQHVIDEIRARGVTYEEFADEVGPEVADRDALQRGQVLIGDELAGKIGSFFGTGSKIWLNLERNFREALAAGKPELNEHNIVTNAHLAWKEANREQGPSGKLLLRIPASLHGRAAELAEKEGVSLNQLLLAFVAEGVGRAEAAAVAPAEPSKVAERRAKYRSKPKSS